MAQTIPEIYKQVKKSIVAIAAKYSTNPVGDIIGTGFIVRSDGVIFTNQHVINAIGRLPKLKGANEWPIVILYFAETEKGMIKMTFEVARIGTLGRERPAEGNPYGPDIPDIGIIQVKMKELPPLKIAKNVDLEEGEDVLLAGYPLGTDTLTAPGWLHQLGPTLQKGIIGAILPFPCEQPHALLIDMVAQHGSSGSPLVNPKNGEVIGILYGGFEKTSISYAISANVVSVVYNLIGEPIKPEELDTFDTIESMLVKKELKYTLPKDPNPEIKKVSIDMIE